MRKSVFTNDLEHCIVSQIPYIHIHHIFGAYNRKRSEKYGFIIPLRPDLHNMSNQGIHFNTEMDLHFKRLAQEYYEAHHGTREDFRKEFGKSWL